MEAQDAARDPAAPGVAGQQGVSSAQEKAEWTEAPESSSHEEVPPKVNSSRR